MPDLPSPIDLNRGGTKRMDPKTGVSVWMYRDEPGVFRNLKGGLVSGTIALSAGFDVAGLTKKRQYLARVQSATDKIKEEYSMVDKSIIKEEGGLGLEKLGKGKAATYNVLDMATGTRLNGMPLTLSQAEGIMIPEEPAEDGIVHPAPDEG